MSSTTASQEELKVHRVPLAWRDQCSAYVLLSLRIREPTFTHPFPTDGVGFLLFCARAQAAAAFERLPQGRVLPAMGM